MYICMQRKPGSRKTHLHYHLPMYSYMITEQRYSSNSASRLSSKPFRFRFIRASEESTHPGAFTYGLVPGASQVRASASVSCPAGSCAMGPQFTVCDTAMLQMSSSVQYLCSEALWRQRVSGLPPQLNPAAWSSPSVLRYPTTTSRAVWFGTFAVARYQLNHEQSDYLLAATCLVRRALPVSSYTALYHSHLMESLHQTIPTLFRLHDVVKLPT